MKTYDAEQIRNIGIIGHGSVGKTSLTEAVLFNAKAIDRLGKVDDGNTTTDYDEDERKRKITINTALGFSEWKKHKLNVIDMPGFGDFIVEAQLALPVADTAVVMVCGVSGVEVMTERTWGFADDSNLPRFIFVNKLDRERASFDRAMESITEAFGDSAIPVQLPIGQEASFTGMVDLIAQKAYTYKDASGKFDEGDIPADMADAAAEARETLIERIAEARDDLTEKYLEEGELTDEEIIEGLKVGILNGTVRPVLCGSAVNNIGVRQLMDAIVAWAPNPLERPIPKGTIGEAEEDVECPPDPDGPVVLYIFKTFIDPFAGRVNLFRVYSGTLTPDTQLYHLRTEQKERINQIACMIGKKHKSVDSLNVGDIGAVFKLSETGTGDTLNQQKDGVNLPAVDIPKPIISFAITAKERSDEDKIGMGLHRLMEEDMTLKFERNEQTKEFLVSGMGQLHIEVVVDRLKQQYGVETVLNEPKVPYLETIKSSIEVRGRYKKQSGGRGQFGDTWVKFEPLPSGSGFEFVNEIVGGAIPKQYIPAVEKGIAEAMQRGIIAGYPAVDIKATLYDGSYHAVDSSEMAFKIAGSFAFKEGAKQCHPTLLEPVMKMEIVVPEENMGDIMGDINSRRGRVLGMDTQRGKSTVNALVPMAEVLKYAPTLTSMTGGRGMYTMEFDHYDEVPTHLQEKIIENAKKAAEEEE